MGIFAQVLPKFWADQFYDFGVDSPKIFPLMRSRLGGGVVGLRCASLGEGLRCRLGQIGKRSELCLQVRIFEINDQFKGTLSIARGVGQRKIYKMFAIFCVPKIFNIVI